VQRSEQDEPEPQSLARMMDLDDEVGTLWEPNELGAVLRHQLDAPVDFDLSCFGPAPGETLRSLRASGTTSITSFRDLLEHPTPPLELLQWTKKFAKSCRSRTDGPLPDEIATVLYFLAIVTALVKCNQRISRLDDQSLKYGLRWALSLKWIDDATRRALEDGCRAVDGRKPDSDH